jgi:hypothetical protein
MEPLTITGSRLNAALYLVLSLVFLAGGVWLVGQAVQVKDLVFGWLSIALFGLAALVFVWLLVRPQVLRLDAEGFSLQGGLVRSPKLTRWRDVQPFFVFHLPRGGKMIGFNYIQDRAPSTTLAFVSGLAGAEAGLPKGWPKSPEAMVAVLNDYRERALAFQSRSGRT